MIIGFKTKNNTYGLDVRNHLIHTPNYGTLKYKSAVIIEGRPATFNLENGQVLRTSTIQEYTKERLFNYL